jgi:uncharacterized membrane protein
MVQMRPREAEIVLRGTPIALFSTEVNAIMPYPNLSIASPASKATAVINFLLGIWIFVSPWVYGAAGNPNAWNSWIVGALIAILALARSSDPVRNRTLGWVNMVFGAWIFFSPWIFGYTLNTGRFVNSLCAGGLVFLISIYGASVQGRMTPSTHPRL